MLAIANATHFITVNPAFGEVLGYTTEYPRTPYLYVARQAAGVAAQVFDPHGAEITDCDCMWTTGNSAIAQVTGSGVVTASSAGTTQVLATLDKGQGIVQVTVT